MSVKVAAGQPKRSGLVVGVGILGTVFIAGFAFWLSFTALTHLARRAGIAEAQAWAWPLIVDGMIVVATVAVVALRDRKGHGYAWLLLGCGAGVSVTANAVQAAMPTGMALPAGLAAAVSSVPPLVLLASTHLTVVLARREDANRANPPDMSAASGPDAATAGDNSGTAAMSAPPAVLAVPAEPSVPGPPPAPSAGPMPSLIVPAGGLPETPAAPVTPPGPMMPDQVEPAELLVSGPGFGEPAGLDGAGLRRLLLGLGDEPAGDSADTDGGESSRTPTKAERDDGSSASPKPRKVLTREPRSTFQVEQAKRLKQAGMSNRAIGARLGVDPTTVGRWLKGNEGDNQ